MDTSFFDNFTCFHSSHVCLWVHIHTCPHACAQACRYHEENCRGYVLGVSSFDSIPQGNNPGADFLVTESCLLEYSPQVFRWDGRSFVWHEKLPVRGVLAVALFSRAGSVFLAISQTHPRLPCLLFKWSGNSFLSFQEVPVLGTTQMEALSSGDDVYLIFAKNVFPGEKIMVSVMPVCSVPKLAEHDACFFMKMFLQES